MSEYLWENADSNWDIFEQLWNDVIPYIQLIEGYIVEGAPPQVAYKKVIKNNKEKHRKIVKLIMILNGKKIEQEKEINIDKYQVTGKDINLLIEEYKKIIIPLN
jgi:hypothetical protein